MLIGQEWRSPPRPACNRPKSWYPRIDMAISLPSPRTSGRPNVCSILPYTLVSGALRIQSWSSRVSGCAERHRRACFPTLSHVLLCTVKPRSECRHADTWPDGGFKCGYRYTVSTNTNCLHIEKRNHLLANHEPIPKRRHQQRKRQQIQSPPILYNRKIVYCRSIGILLCSSWSEQLNTTIQKPQRDDEESPIPSDPVRGRDECQCP